jgi:quercetin dioxygenase-like cupin family protein
MEKEYIVIIKNIPFETTDWSKMKGERHEGETGYALWKVRQCGDIRVRVVEYSANYKADHWCSKGHILYCLQGEITTELKDGRVIQLHKGMSYQVEDENYPHSSHTKNGAVLFIVD